MADETETKKKLPWGRYEHESGAWIQFKRGPYRYREQREWKASVTDLQLYAWMLSRLEAWHFLDADGNELDLETLRALGVEAMNLPASDATEERLRAAITAVQRFESAFDEVDVSMLQWWVKSGSQFVYVDMLSAPKA